MKRDFTIFTLGAISALVLNAFFFSDKNQELSALIPDQRAVESTGDEAMQGQESNLNNQRLTAVEQQFDADSQEMLAQSDSLESEIDSHTSEKATNQVMSIDKKDLPPGFSSKTDYEKAFQDESVDPVQKEKREMAIRELFDQERAFELNVGLQDIECRSERCRLEIFPIDGNSRFFSMMDVMQIVLVKSNRTLFLENFHS